MRLSTYNSPLGVLFFWFDHQELVYVSFNEEDAKRWQARHFPKRTILQSPLVPELKRAFDNYFQGGNPTWEQPLRLIGTDFQLRVWREIQQIPYGQFTTYKKIADKLQSRAFQAVGQAVGANPISIIIPCHRVLGTNWFGGYGGGLNRKRLLLELENITLALNSQA